jgi:hypothetical protein
VVGLLLELGHLAHMPLGGAQLPEPGPGAVVAGAVAGLVGGGSGLALGFTLGLGLSWLGGRTVVWHRQATANRLASAAGAGLGGALGAILARTLVWDGLRGTALVGLGLTLLHSVPGEGWSRFAQGWPLSFEFTTLILAFAALPGVGEVARIAEPHSVRRLTLFLSGLGVGVVFALSIGVASFLGGAG